MIFFSSKPEKVGKKISRRLGKELKTKEPPAYQVEQQGGQGAYEPKDMVKDVGAMIFGGSRSSALLYLFRFERQEPREWQLEVEVIHGVGRVVVLGGLLFTAPHLGARDFVGTSLARSVNLPSGRLPPPDLSPTRYPPFLPDPR